MHQLALLLPLLLLAVFCSRSNAFIAKPQHLTNTLRPSNTKMSPSTLLHITSTPQSIRKQCNQLYMTSIPIMNILQTYDVWLTKYPLITKMISSGAIGGIGDYITQTIETPSKTNTRRMLLFTFVSVFYFAPFIHYWFGYLEWLILKFASTKSDLYQATVMILIDQIIGAIILKTGFFYSYTFADQILPYNPITTTNTSTPFDFISKANTLVKQKLITTLKANWLFWPFINFVNFRWISLPYRVLFSNVAALFWNMFLSNLVNKKN